MDRNSRTNSVDSDKIMLLKKHNLVYCLHYCLLDFLITFFALSLVLCIITLSLHNGMVFICCLLVED